jgi:hypothetical protein
MAYVQEWLKVNPYTLADINTSATSTYGKHIKVCRACGAITFPNAQHGHEQWHKETERNETMSNVTWCDRGDHAFKAASPGSARYTIEQPDENGETLRMTQDACPEHNPYAPAKASKEAERKRLTAEVEAELMTNYGGHNED